MPQKRWLPAITDAGLRDPERGRVHPVLFPGQIFEGELQKGITEADDP